MAERRTFDGTTHPALRPSPSLALLGAARRLHSHAVSAGSAAVRDDLPACSCVVSAGALLLQLHGSRGSAARNAMAHGSTSTPLAAQRLAWLNVTQRVAADSSCSSASRNSAILATASRSATRSQTARRPPLSVAQLDGSRVRGSVAHSRLAV